MSQIDSGLSDPTVVQEEWLAFVTNAWSRTVIQPFLIAIMTTALISGPLAVLQIMSPQNGWLRLTFVCFLVVLESIYTTIWLSRPNQRSLNRLAYRAAEFIVIAILFRFLAWILTGSWPTLKMWQTFLFEPLTIFADIFFLISVIVVFFAWQRAITTTEIFSALTIDRAEAAFFANAFGKHKLDTRPTVTNRGVLVSSFLQQWLFGGLVLVICTALTTFDLSSRSSVWSLREMARLELPAPIITALILYFLAGFVLLSQGKLAMMNARWLINGITKGQTVERSWARTSLRILLLIAFAAAFLPLGSTLAFSRIISAFIGFVTAVITTIVVFFISLLAILLPSFREIDVDLPPPEPIQPPPLPQSPLPSDGDSLSMFFSSAFWAVAIVMTVIAVMFFFRERGIRLQNPPIRHFWDVLKEWLLTIWANLSHQIKTARQAIQLRQPSQGKDKTVVKQPPWRFFRLNALSPRDQLRYFYLSTVRRAGEQGVPRDENETPLEFAQDLIDGWPDAETDVDSLTNAFLKARYSGQPVVKDDVHPIKHHWRRFRSKLRQRRSSAKSDS